MSSICISNLKKCMLTFLPILMKTLYINFLTLLFSFKKLSGMCIKNNFRADLTYSCIGRWSYEKTCLLGSRVIKLRYESLIFCKFALDDFAHTDLLRKYVPFCLACYPNGNLLLNNLLNQLSVLESYKQREI